MSLTQDMVMISAISLENFGGETKKFELICQGNCQHYYMSRTTSQKASVTSKRAKLVNFKGDGNLKEVLSNIKTSLTP